MLLYVRIPCVGSRRFGTRAGVVGAFEFRPMDMAFEVAWLKSFWRMRSANARWREDGFGSGVLHKRLIRIKLVAKASISFPIFPFLCLYIGLLHYISLQQE
jgi:hypothetical protein